MSWQPLTVEEKTILFPFQVHMLIPAILKIGSRIRTLFMSGISFAFYLALVVKV